ncbi:MAG TPA: PEFG-CTERM sorting domain-containing protein, partial [Nitrosopumilaceae archaeon]|nr:PEFG-CTERM sorting domain-containing protein [Nitrosopumilaceae archaeon]
FLIGLFHEDKMIFRNYFFTQDGNLLIEIIPTKEGEIEIIGEKDDFLGAWYATESQPIQVTGPIFESGGLFHFEIEIRTIDESTNIVEGLGVYTADVSVVDTTNHFEKDLEGNDVKFRVKSYFDKISEFKYNSEEKLVTFSIPFDWSEKTISHIPVVHEEVHFPKDFSEFLSPGYIGKVNGVNLFKSSVTIDDYTEEDERIVHFVLLSEHLKFIKNEQKKLEMELPEKMVFTLTPSNEVDFPLTAMTKNEEIQVDLSWEPYEIQPGESINFIFTIRDGATGENLRQSSYDFIIIQNGKIIHKTSGNAVVGGSFEQFTFSEDQTGPTIIQFENIRGTGLETEFGLLVVPEFGSIVIMILVLMMASVVILSKKNSLSKLQFS